MHSINYDVCRMRRSSQNILKAKFNGLVLGVTFKWLNFSCKIMALNARQKWCSKKFESKTILDQKLLIWGVGSVNLLVSTK